MTLWIRWDRIWKSENNIEQFWNATWSTTSSLRTIHMIRKLSVRLWSFFSILSAPSANTSVDRYYGDQYQYEIPADALEDEQFAAMIQEAEKYLGYPYVWGGSSPSTSFDCSGFVSWVINHCGVGWDVGRLTANGLRNICSYVSPANAKPGDLIFFEKTYDTSGASHVGIYVGNNTMIHCGDPIQYTSIDTNYR